MDDIQLDSVKGGNLLLAEDDPNLLKVLSIRLKDKGFKIFTATNGEDALELVKVNPIEVIVSDYMMPKMTGWDFCVKVKSEEAYKHIYFILLTAKTDRETKIATLSGGADDFLTKPYDFAELLARIDVGLRTNRLYVELVKKNEEIKRMFEEKMQLQEGVIKSEKLASVGRLAAGMAHEINNPLEVISNYAQILLKSKQPRSDQEKECITLIHSETVRIAKLIRNLLSYSRDEALSLVPTKINKVIKDSTILTGHQYEMEKKQLTQELCNEDLEIPASAAHLQQVFINMINNARQALPEGGKLVVRSSIDQNNQNQQFIRIDFADNGNGIPKDIQPRLFEPFFTTKGREKGTGLGLYVSKAIIERHRGMLKVESEVGKGTTFFIYLPLK